MHPYIQKMINDGPHAEIYLMIFISSFIFSKSLLRLLYCTALAFILQFSLIDISKFHVVCLQNGTGLFRSV